MKSTLFGENLESQSTEKFTLQNERMLKVQLNGEMLARQGSMVAYQGSVNFEFQGGGLGRFLKKAITGEGVPLMKCTGQADVFFAHNADEIHLLHLENESVTINGQNILAFDSTLEWDVKRVEGVSMFGGGLFNTVLSGTGTLAVVAHGTPVVLRTDAPTFVDVQSAVGWSSTLTTSVHRSVKLGALVGRGSGEAFQLSFAGDGFVIVQASEGPTVPPHSHG